MTIQINAPREIAQIASVLADAGFEAVLVGGCVRDSLLRRQAKDWDLATNARPEQVGSLFPAAVVTTRFGTTLVPVAGQPAVEVTTYRTEHGYTDFRRPDHVAYTGSLAEDLARRDFTINALAYDPVTKILHDPFGGQADLASRSLRAVGRADDRFGEDALRLLRAVRFVSQLGFDIESDTARAIGRHAHLISELALERVGIEVGKLLVGPYAAKAIAQAEQLDLWQRIMHEMSGDKSRAHAVRVASLTGVDLSLNLAALLHHAEPESAQARLLKLAFGADVAGQAKKLIEIAALSLPSDDSPAATARAIRRWDHSTLEQGLLLRAICERELAGNDRTSTQLRQRAEQVYRSGLPLRISDLAIDGNQLLSSLGLREGPVVGKLLKQLLEDVTDGSVPNKSNELLARAGQLHTS